MITLIMIILDIFNTIILLVLKFNFLGNYLWIKYYLVEFKLFIRIKIFNLRFNYVFTKYLVEFTLFN